ncbi:MAG: amino acid permease [Sinobacteraceae bacterium]|nr:amino acid permease [Nevskiaceae bacterium]
MSKTGADADQWGERLPRQIGLFNAVAVLIGVTIGSGIFRVPATVAAMLHDPGPVLLCWLLGGVVALCGALTLAELAAALPRSGGIFAYLLESYGPLPAFMFGWTELVVIRASALGATAAIFADYLGYFVPLSGSQVRYVAALAIVAIGILNYLGVTLAAQVMTFATAAKYVSIVALALLAFTAVQGGGAHFTPVWSAAGLQWTMLGSALISVMWTYDGWADLSFMGGEVSNPQRTLPLALVFGTIGVMFVYLLLNVAFIYVLPLPQMAQSKLIAASVAEHIPVLRDAGAAIVTALVLVSTFSGLNGSMMTGPRIFFAMADRQLFFRGLARVSPRYRSPSMAIALATVLGVTYVLLNDFSQLADRFILGIWPFYALAVAGVFTLRRRRPELLRPYRVIGYPLVPALFLLASLGMILNALLTDPVNTGITFAIIASGVPLYLLWMARKRV